MLPKTLFENSSIRPMSDFAQGKHSTAQKLTSEFKEFFLRPCLFNFFLLFVIMTLPILKSYSQNCPDLLDEKIFKKKTITGNYIIFK